MNPRLPTTSIDIQKCADNIGNRFDMVIVASRRARELERGHRSLVNTSNGPVISALQEIEAGEIGLDYLKRINYERRR